MSEVDGPDRNDLTTDSHDSLDSERARRTEEDLRKKDERKKVALFAGVFVITAIFVFLVSLPILLNKDKDEKVATTDTTATSVQQTQATGAPTSNGNQSNGNQSQVTTSPTTAPLAANVKNPCKASDFEASIGDIQAAETQRAFTVELKARSTANCTLSGSPVVALYNDTDAIATKSTPESGSAAASVEMKPGKSAKFSVSYPASTDQSCPTATLMVVTPPGDNQNVRIPLTGQAISRVCNNTALSTGKFAG